MKKCIVRQFLNFIVVLLFILNVSCNKTASDKTISVAVQADSLAKVEIVAEINAPYPDMSGIVVTDDGRIFLTFPRHADNHKEFSLAEYKDGKLIPFPNKEMTYPSDKHFDQWLVSPHGMTLDDKGNIWVIDDGKRAGVSGIPEGAAKVVGFDPKNGHVIKTIVINAPALRQDSHLNDLRVDLAEGKEGIVYVTNSSFGHIGSLVVIDISTGKSSEVLADHISTQPQKGYVAFLEGEARAYDPENVSLPSGGADGIALSGGRVFWTSITGRGLYSIQSGILSDFSKSESDIENAVKYEGERPACDGLAEDKDGNIYFGAYEQMALVKRNSKGHYTTLARDQRFGWPDGLFYAKNGYLYVTLGQWNRLPGFNGGKDLRERPYLVARIKIV